jgi:hypothetical protein
MKKAKILRVVKDRFNLFESGRIDSQDFMPAIESIKRTLASPLVKQGFDLGEHFGYYGHEVRSETGKLRPSDVEFIKGTKVNVIPDCITTELSISDDGTVDFTQEIYETDGGKAISVMIDSNIGGWSWATGSANGHRIMTDFAGLDYVKRPNYISTQKAMMLASTTADRSELVSSLIEAGLSEEKANEKLDIINSGDSVSRIDYNNAVEELELMHLVHDGSNVVDLESRIAEANAQAELAQQNSQALMLACIDSLPVYVSDEVKGLALQSTDKPNEAMEMILASVGKMSEQDKLMLASAGADTVTVNQNANSEGKTTKFNGYKQAFSFPVKS